MEQEMAAEIFNVKKSLRHFSTVTPEGRKVEGWMCDARRENFGSLIIETVDGVETLQFVRGMPKIGYYTQYFGEMSGVHILHKEDGTNILAFPLIVDGEVVEVCHKTRTPDMSDAMCSKDYLDKAMELWDSNYQKAVEQERKSLSFELYGVRNSHEVAYRHLDIPELNLDLISVLDQGHCYPVPQMKELANKYGLPHIIEAFQYSFDEGMGELSHSITATPEFIDRFGDFLPTYEGNPITQRSAESVYALRTILRNDYLEQMNLDFKEKYSGGIITEGTVWHCGLEENFMLKNKPSSVEEGHIKAACGVSTDDVRKAIRKADENMNLKEEFKKRKQGVIDFISLELLEEYDEKIVYDERAVNKIRSEVAKYIKKIIIPPHLIEVADKLKEKHGADQSPAVLMNAFAQEYPELKEDAGKVYQALVRA